MPKVEIPAEWFVEHIDTCGGRWRLLKEQWNPEERYYFYCDRCLGLAFRGYKSYAAFDVVETD